jgi:type VI secretion system secreted protein VgrG
MLLEQYQYPHLYQLQKEGSRYANLQLLRQLTFRSLIEAESDVARFLPSYTFRIHEHPRDDVNSGWWVVSVRHEGKQSGVLEHEAPDEPGLEYRSQVTAIPEMTRFIPALEHPKTLVPGEQTAIVTGPKGEEIYPDKYGRVKVQFFWDREGQRDDKTTCWIRVAQGWAGTQYGAMAIPRIGHEVVVSFLEGNPDRPLITGRVYHGLNRPPYELPEHKTRTVFKSMSTPGKEGEARGYNELRIEDKKGKEEIFVHGEKDVNIHVKNDWKEHILHDQHRTVDKFSYSRILGEDHQIVEGDQLTEIKGDIRLYVHADSHTEIKKKILLTAIDEIHFESLQKMVIEGGLDLTFKVGESFIRLTPAGVTLHASDIVTAGEPGSGTPVEPLYPKTPYCLTAPRLAAQNHAVLCRLCATDGTS